MSVILEMYSMALKKLWSLASCKSTVGYEGHDGGKLRINSDHLGFLNVRPNHCPQAFLHSAAIAMWSSLPGIQPVTSQ